MKLSDWMAENGLSDDQVAEKTGVDRATISRLRRSKHRPSWELALKIWVLSGGSVKADDFLQEQAESAA